MVNNILANVEKKMKAVSEGLKQELSTLRTGRASPALVEHIKVDYAGVPTPLNQLASISVPEARLIVIQPWDPGSMHSIEQAILKSDLGLNPVNDGRVIRLSIPPLSEERRKELTKIVHKRLEERRVAVRNLRRDALEDLKKAEKNKEISQDESRRIQDQLQKLTDLYIGVAEKIAQDKEKELLEV
ncbi:MAG: ribosome recycling factor [Dehalococcoidales bacterium]|jgi:ribosome recycling factor|nr:ribosome recycling factor [Dehalococcoidales bacterium]